MTLLDIALYSPIHLLATTGTYNRERVSILLGNPLLLTGVMTFVMNTLVSQFDPLQLIAVIIMIQTRAHAHTDG